MWVRVRVFISVEPLVLKKKVHSKPGLGCLSLKAWKRKRKASPRDAKILIDGETAPVATTIIQANVGVLV